MNRSFQTNLLVLVIALGLGGCATDPPNQNQPPSVTVDVGSTVDYVVGESPVRITVTGSDPEGGVVRLGIVDAPARAKFEVYDGWAVFSWDPLASDTTAVDEPRQLIFYAEDDLGARSERVVNLRVLPGNGVPRFVSSPSILHNVDQNRPVIFDVVVRDDDSPRVALVMPLDKAPDGAVFTVTGDTTGRFNWEPTADQLKHRVHSVTFLANDGQNPVVEQKVSILLNKAGGEDSRPKLTDNPGESTGCAFEDAVRHTPLGAQRGADDYRVEAYLSAEAAAKFDRLVINWTDQDLWNDYSLQPQGAEMTAEGGVFVASIPNPLLPAGQSKEYYYEICAIDDDSSDEDAVLCGPTNIYNSFIAYSPENQGVCIDDPASNQTFDDALSINDLDGWERLRGCGASRPDYFRVDLTPQQNVDVYFTFPFGQDVGIEMYDEGRNVLPFSVSTCSGYGYIFIENTEMQNVTRYFRVIATDVPYQMSPWFYETASACSDAAFEPNGTVATAVPISTDGASQSGAVCGVGDRDVYSFFASAGEQITTRLNFTHADGDLDLELYGPADEANVDVDGTPTESSLGLTDVEEIVHTAAETGVYHAVVFGYGEDNEYTLSNRVEAGGACSDNDKFAPNGTRSTAKNMSLERHTALTLCAGTEDWTSFTLFSGEYVTITVRATTGDIQNMSVTAWEGMSVAAAGIRNGDKITLDLNPADISDFLLEIESSSDVTYEIDVSFFL